MTLKYIQHYPESLQQQVQQLIDSDQLGTMLQKKYPKLHQIRSNRALYDYAIELKNQFMRKSAPLSKVEFSDKTPAHNALGIHQRISKVHGGKIKSKKEIHIDSRFKDAPEPFLRMILIHELAHFKELEHNKAFYNLCLHMEPDYHQLEFDLRLYLTYLELAAS